MNKCGCWIPHIIIFPNETKTKLEKLNIKPSSIDYNVLITPEFNIAEVTTTMTFYNEHDKFMEGEFKFALPQNAKVCGFAMEIKKDNFGAYNMEEGVIVEKKLARKAYESIVKNREGQTGLIEEGDENVYRARIYSFNKNTTRKIKISYIISINESYKLYIPSWNFLGQIQAKFVINTNLSLSRPYLTVEGVDSIIKKGFSDVIDQSNKTFYELQYNNEQLIGMGWTITMPIKSDNNKPLISINSSNIFSIWTGKEKKTLTSQPYKKVVLIWDGSLGRFLKNDLYSSMRLRDNKNVLLKIINSQQPKTQVDLYISKIGDGTKPVPVLSITADDSKLVEKIDNAINDIHYDGARNVNETLDKLMIDDTTAVYIFSDKKNDNWVYVKSEKKVNNVFWPLIDTNQQKLIIKYDTNDIKHVHYAPGFFVLTFL